jgi:hypothetical protein
MKKGHLAREPLSEWENLLIFLATAVRGPVKGRVKAIDIAHNFR